MTKYGQFYNRKQYLLFSNWTRFSWYEVFCVKGLLCLFSILTLACVDETLWWYHSNETSVGRLLHPTYSFSVFCKSKFEFLGEICCLMAATRSEGFKMNLSHTRKGRQILVSLRAPRNTSVIFMFKWHSFNWRLSSIFFLFSTLNYLALHKFNSGTFSPPLTGF